MREDDDKLLDFCVGQRSDFNQSDWLSYPAESNIKLVALLLLCGEWYGRKKELNRLCRGWGLTPGALPKIVGASHFDVPRFVGMLKKRLSLR